MPFRLRRLSDDREAAAVIQFFPNLLTPYFDKIGSLRANRNDVLVDIDNRISIARNDGDALTANADDIIRGDVRIRYSDAEKEAYLDQFRNMSASEVRNLSGDYDARTWTVEKYEARQKAAEIRREQLAEARDGIWGDVAGADLIEDEYKTDAQRRQEFLAQFKNRAPSVEYTQFNDEIIQERNRKTRENRRRENQQRQRDEMRLADEESRRNRRNRK